MCERIEVVMALKKAELTETVEIARQARTILEQQAERFRNEETQWLAMNNELLAKTLRAGRCEVAVLEQYQAEFQTVLAIQRRTEEEQERRASSTCDHVGKIVSEMQDEHQKERTSMQRQLAQYEFREARQRDELADAEVKVRTVPPHAEIGRLTDHCQRLENELGAILQRVRTLEAKAVYEDGVARRLELGLRPVCDTVQGLCHRIAGLEGGLRDLEARTGATSSRTEALEARTGETSSRTDTVLRSLMLAVHAVQQLVPQAELRPPQVPAPRLSDVPGAPPQPGSSASKELFPAHPIGADGVGVNVVAAAGATAAPANPPTTQNPWEHYNPSAGLGATPAGNAIVFDKRKEADVVRIPALPAAPHFRQW